MWRNRVAGRARTIGNRVTDETVREFESLFLRHFKKPGEYWIFQCPSAFFALLYFTLYPLSHNNFYLQIILTKGVNTGYNIGDNLGDKRGGKMKKQECLTRIEELTKEIDLLPKGYISKKEIGGKIYFYHQWYENGSKKSFYLKNEELSIISEQLERRKELQKKLKTVKEELANNMTFKRTTVTHVNCTLMHKNIAVVDLELDEADGTIYKIGNVYASEHLPLGVVTKTGKPDKTEFNNWWLDRSIPDSRSGVREALESMHLDNIKSLLVRCYGLSLSDQYWICPEGTNLQWKKINFFNNTFSEDIGDILFGAQKKENAIHFSSPDNTSDGNLKKRWKIIDGNRYLVKGGSNPYRQQPFNEVIATKIMERLGVPCIAYSLFWNKGAPYSVCADFVDENTELIPAWRILKTQKQPNNVSLYQHFLNCAEKLGIPNVIPFLDRMIVVDYLILNEDRHLNNFGALRNAETLQWIGMAPIYDSGSSLGYDKTAALMNVKDEIICKPFKKHHDEQLKLVSSFDWIDFSALSDIRSIISEVFSGENVADYINENRINVISYLAEQRVLYLKKFASSHHKQSVSLDDELKDNKAAEYGNH